MGRLTAKAGGSGGGAAARYASRCLRARRVPCSWTAKSPGRRRSRHGCCPAGSRCSSAPDSRLIMADTLLLVDDDASVLRAIGDYFERIGYEVWRDGTGEGAGGTVLPGRPGVGVAHLRPPPPSRAP